MNWAGTQPLGDWMIGRKENLAADANAWGNAKLYANTVASIDYDEKNEGASSIKLTGYIPKELPNVCPSILQKVTLKKNTLYKLTFDAKAEK